MMNIQEIRDLKPAPHPTKRIFREHGLQHIQIAAAVGRSYNHTCGVLCGLINPGPEMNRKLWALADQIEGKAGEDDVEAETRVDLKL